MLGRALVVPEVVVALVQAPSAVTLTAPIAALPKNFRRFICGNAKSKIYKYLLSLFGFFSQMV